MILVLMGVLFGLQTMIYIHRRSKRQVMVTHATLVTCILSICLMIAQLFSGSSNVTLIICVLFWAVVLGLTWVIIEGMVNEKP